MAVCQVRGRAGASGGRAVSAAVAPLLTHGASPIKRLRRTKAEIETLRRTICRLLAAVHPMTVRQVFYRLVSLGAIAKTEGEYKTTVCRLLVEMRRSGAIPFGWIADNTRWMRKPRTYSGLEEALRVTAETYRRAVWDAQDAYVEVWTEKDAIAGVLYQETEQWDVPLMVTRGYPSLSFLHGAGEATATVDKPVYLYYFGDHDPSGVHIPTRVEAELRAFAPEAEIHFERVAVTPEQIVAWDLPTRPTKQTDSRSRGFEGESVEVDAIEPGDLRRLASECITRHVDRDMLLRLEAVEREERASLVEIAMQCVPQ